MNYRRQIFKGLLALSVLAFSQAAFSATPKECKDMAGTYQVAPITEPRGLAEISRYVLNVPTYVPGTPIFTVTIENGQAWHTGLISGTRVPIELDTTQAGDSTAFAEKVDTPCVYKIGDELTIYQVDFSKNDATTLKEVTDGVTLFWSAFLEDAQSRGKNRVFDVSVLKPRTLNADTVKKIRYFAIFYDWRTGMPVPEILPLEKT
ncbi:hypothetical protein [Collimonas pratensis]|uniref:Uncharacterized protein n=1 Tax=Collimonas pratensis TaxID=279113 RepID=A0ABM5Z006_9BURK|nr:hypothetical protein [Collimonas pratensis]AMP12332.1 hypothetical protein CPter291_0036 [Collimonas pratensis]